MGLLPEADLVWVTSDDKLFLWSYNSTSSTAATSSVATSTPLSSQTMNEDYCSFTVPSGQCIVSVGLVHPKSNVFTKSVEWCIVVTTPEEAILCALAKESTEQQPQSVNDAATNGHSNNGVGGGGFRHGNSSLRLIPTRFVLPTDSVPLTSICSTTVSYTHLTLPTTPYV